MDFKTSKEYLCSSLPPSDSPKIRPSDISFALTVVINAMLPPKSGTRHHPAPGTTGAPGSCAPPKTGVAGDMPTHTNVAYRDTNAVVTDTLYEAGFLGKSSILLCTKKQSKKKNKQTNKTKQKTYVLCFICKYILGCI